MPYLDFKSEKKKNWTEKKKKKTEPNKNNNKC